MAAELDFLKGVPANRTKTCFTLPMLNSHGLDLKSPAKFLKYSVPLLELQIGIIVTMTFTLHALLKRFGITMFICQVLTGIILGPTFLGRLEIMKKVIFSHESQELICTVEYFGYAIYIFISAVKIDIGATIRSTGKVVLITGAVSVIAPMVFGLLLVRPPISGFLESGIHNEAMQVVLMNSFSTFSIIIHVLDELKLVNTELGLLALSASLVADGVGLSITTLVTVLQQKLSSISSIIDMSATTGFMIFSGFIIRPVLFLIIRKTPQGSAINSDVTYILIAMACMSAVYFHVFHQLQCIGAFAFGMMIPAGPPLGSALVKKFDTFMFSILLSVGVATSVMRADLSLIIYKFDDINLYLMIIILTFGAKLVACLLPSLYWNIPFIDSLIFAVIMTCRGNIELAYYILARDTLMISEDVFALLILCMILNSTFVAITVKCLYDPSRKYAGYQARNILHLKPKAELRILACVHQPENITCIIGLLDAFHANKDRFISLYVLHLIQLIGRNTPLVISHQKQKPVSDSRAHNVVISFSQYEQRNWDSVSVSTFTALSPSKSMNGDITLLAFDKLTSLILLPLHRKWSIHGIITAEDNFIRTVNLKVLEKAPCSVGIFFDRGKLGRGASEASSSKTSRSICMIFLGGPDDRETLSLAKRISKDSSASVTVIRFIPESVHLIDSEESLLDAWALEEIKQIVDNSKSKSNLEYREHTVKDGADTAFALRSIADDYDLFLVGRRFGIESPQTGGLSEWPEIPELGIIGDLLASKYLNTKAAVLVVQQQKKLK
ncbi:cation/H(+) antiporter 4-like [Mercurialis annua]|uniref:cation/H(+) antiporter 4-like n=1 Tax=Mercurialis annua TaxID=3986 RepID=UPI002160A582|nr:cation/H(+) antiporter 4-like [Mercurialis annua]